MDYTSSPQFAVHPGTGNRLHDDSIALPTVLSDSDINQVTWSMMEVVKAAGLPPSTFDPNVPATYIQFLQALQSIVVNTVPIGVSPGMVGYFAVSAPPAGWIKCNGATISRASYPGLFAAVGVYFGAGDGATTFQIPDLRAMFLRGLDDGRGVDVGRILGSIQADTFKAHTHNYIGTGNFTAGGAEGGGRDAAGTGPEYTSFSTGDFETRPINVALAIFIKY